jgi:hypothetical protein
VHGVAELADAVALYFEQPELRRAAGRAAYTLITDNQGALTRTLGLMTETLATVGFTEEARTAKKTGVGLRFSK